MSKSQVENWAITGVSYNAARTHIVQVEVRPIINGDFLGKPEIASRDAVVRVLESGARIITAPPRKNSGGGFDRGARVEIVEDGRNKYITTTPNRTKRDNLGNLPEF